MPAELQKEADTNGEVSNGDDAKQVVTPAESKADDQSKTAEETHAAAPAELTTENSKIWMHGIFFFFFCQNYPKIALLLQGKVFNSEPELFRRWSDFDEIWHNL